MKKNILSYSAPEVNVFEVVAERGYNVSEPIIGGGAGPPSQASALRAMI